MPKLHAQPTQSTHSPYTPTHTPTLFPTANPSSSPVETCPADCSSSGCDGYTCTENSECCATIGEECVTFLVTCYDKTKGFSSTLSNLDCTMICTDSSNQTKVEEDCAGLGIDSANIGCVEEKVTTFCTVESRNNAGKCFEGD